MESESEPRPPRPRPAHAGEKPPPGGPLSSARLPAEGHRQGVWPSGRFPEAVRAVRAAAVSRALAQPPSSRPGLQWLFPATSGSLLSLSRFAKAPQAVRKLALAWWPGGLHRGRERRSPQPAASGQLLSLGWNASPSVPGGWSLECHGARLCRREIATTACACGGPPTWCQQLLIRAGCHRMMGGHSRRGLERPQGPVAFTLFNTAEPLLQTNA